MRKTFRYACAAIGLLCFFLPAGFGQTITVSLGGTVADATGALMPGVEVTSTNVGTGIVTRTLTNETGVYQFPAIQSGTYRVSAELPGFQTKVYENVALGTAQQVRLNFTLEVGTVATAIEVSISADTLLATTSTSVATVLPEYKVTELPLASRNVLDLVQTQVGVRTGGMSDAGAIFAGTSATNVNTTRDGMSVNDTRHNDSGAYSVAYTSPDLVQEVRVIVAAADAEYGRGGGQVQMETRSGTNQFHGSMFYTNRNSALQASSWNNNFNGVTKNYENRNQFGGRIGGPIIPNKTFFFTLFDGQRYITKQSVVGNVLTPTARQGLFRYFPGVQSANASANVPTVDALGNPVKPAAATGDLQTRSVFGIDPNRAGYDASGWVQSVLARMPLPNDFRTGDGLNTAGIRWTLRRKALDGVTGSSPDTDRNQINVRVDHNFNQSNKLFGTMTEEWTTSETQDTPWPDIKTGDAAGRGVFNKRPRIYTSSFLSTLSPSVVNEFRFGVRSLYLNSVSSFERKDLNGPELFALLPVRNNIPFIPKSQLFTENFINGGFNGSRGNDAPRWSVADSLSWVRGQHAFKGGFEWGVTHAKGWINQQVYPYANMGAGGSGIVGLNTTNFPGAVGADLTQAGRLMTDLAGSVDSINQAFVLAGPDDIRFIDVSEAGLNEVVPNAIQFFLRDWRQRDFSWFFKDDWKAASSLTINLGVRWDYYGPAWDNYGLMAGPVGGAAKAAYGISGTGPEALWRPGASGGSPTKFQLIGPHSQNPDEQLWKGDWNNFGPSAGLSWSLPWGGQDKTVLRLGYGMNYTDSYDISTLANGQFATPGTGLIPLYTQPGLMTLNTLPVPVPVPANPFAPVPFDTRSLSVTLYNQERPTAYVQNFNASIQRELTRNLTLDVQYVGTKGTKLKNGDQINAVNIFENGILDAFNVTRAGGNAPLFDQMFSGLNLGLGNVNGSTVRGSESLRQNSIFRDFLANGDVGQFADDLNRRALFGELPGGIFRNHGLPENFIVVNPQFRTLNLLAADNMSTYHSLNLSLNKRMSQGFASQTQYTWSRNIGLQDGEGTTTYLNPRDHSLNKTILSSHRTHEFRQNGVFELPFGPGRLLLGDTSGILARIVEQWQISGIFRLTSGAPLTITASTSTIIAGTGNTPVLLGDFPKSSGTLQKVANGAIYFEGLQQVADPGRDAVTALQGLQNRNSNLAIADASGNFLLVNPSPGQLGTLGQRWIEGPGEIGLDVAFSKGVRLGEGKEFILRMDGLNILNHPNFGNPTTDINSTNFGRITSASGTRSIVISGRVNF